MAPSLRDIRQAASKKRKAREEGAPTERRAVAKVPKRAVTKRADAEGTGIAEPSRKREDVRVHTTDPGREEVVKAEAGEEVVRSLAGVDVPLAPAPPITLPDSSPEQVARASSPPAEAVGSDAAHVTAMPGPTTVMPLRQDATSAPPATEAPGAGDAASSSGGRGRVDPSLRSILDHHSRWAEQTLEEASVVEVQGLLRQQGRATFFREASVAHLWSLNTLIAMRDLWIQSDGAIDQVRGEMLDLQGRAERAEMALEDTRSALMDKAETARLRAERAEYALEVAQRKAAAELDGALVAEENQKKAEESQKKAEESQKEAEEKLAAMESEMHILLDKLHSTSFELNIASKKAERAEGAARVADVEIAALKVATNEAERESAEAKKRVLDAEERAAEAEKKATEAVENFRKSRAFDKELAGATAFAYESGFQDCKEKVQRLYSPEGIEDLEPDEPSEDDGPTQ